MDSSEYSEHLSVKFKRRSSILRLFETREKNIFFDNWIKTTKIFTEKIHFPSFWPGLSDEYHWFPASKMLDADAESHLLYSIQETQNSTQSNIYF